jgi:hypothetical protein
MRARSPKSTIGDTAHDVANRYVGSTGRDGSHGIWTMVALSKGYPVVVVLFKAPGSCRGASRDSDIVTESPR